MSSSRLGRRSFGSARLAVALLRAPSVGRDLPQWVRDAPTRRDPLRTRQPWWNYPARRFIEQRLTTGANVFEFGAGASTLWLLDKGCRVRSVEHDPDWYRAIQSQLGNAMVVRLVPHSAGDSAYAESILEEKDASFDLVIVDGGDRVRCGELAMGKVRPGGLLLLDDSQRTEYDPLHAMLRTWSAERLFGLKPGDWEPRATTVWTRPE